MLPATCCAYLPAVPRPDALVLVLVTHALLGSCAGDDIGTPCHLLRADGTEAAPIPGHHLVLSGSGECEQLVCASFSGASPVCSRPCQQVGEGCEGSFVCRAAVLDEPSLIELRKRTEGTDLDGNGSDDFDQLAGGVVESLYCGPPP